jgi:hypothetical protein
MRGQCGLLGGHAHWCVTLWLPWLLLMARLSCMQSSCGCPRSIPLKLLLLTSFPGSLAAGELSWRAVCHCFERKVPAALAAFLVAAAWSCAASRGCHDFGDGRALKLMVTHFGETVHQRFSPTISSTTVLLLPVKAHGAWLIPLYMEHG